MANSLVSPRNSFSPIALTVPIPWYACDTVSPCLYSVITSFRCATKQGQSASLLLLLLVGPGLQCLDRALDGRRFEQTSYLNIITQLNEFCKCIQEVACFAVGLVEPFERFRSLSDVPKVVSHNHGCSEAKTLQESSHSNKIFGSVSPGSADQKIDRMGDGGDETVGARNSY